MIRAIPLYLRDDYFATWLTIAPSSSSFVKGLSGIAPSRPTGPEPDRNRPSLLDSMMTGVSFEYFVVLDQRAGLIAVESRHHDVDENDVRTMVGDLRQRVEGPSTAVNTSQPSLASSVFRGARRMVFAYRR